MARIALYRHRANQLQRRYCPTMSQNLLNLSYTVIHNSIQFKMDKIADVFIHGLPYFTVFRRYNSPYEIVLEDMKGETYVHKDQTVRESLQAALCLSHEHAAQLYTHSAHSYRHNAALCPFATNLAELRWSDIQDHYGAVFVDFGGILLEFQEVCAQYAHQGQAQQPCRQEQPPCTPPQKQKPKVAPNAPRRSALKNEIIYHDSPSSSQETQYSETEEPWSILVPITEESLIPRIHRAGGWWCVCEEKEEEDTHEDDTNFIVLRNGTRIRKIQTKQPAKQNTHKKQKCH